MTRVLKIITGGQTGADIAGWRAAKVLGLHTGGWMPKNFRNEAGHHPQYAAMYNAKEHVSHFYAERTKLNVRDADGTVIFGDITSAGSRVTLDECRQQNKPWLYIAFGSSGPPTVLTPPQLLAWLSHWGVETLNVAGNRESGNPGIEQFTYDFLIHAMTP